MSEIASINFLDNVNANPFPNENIEPSVKNTPAFGLRVGKAIFYRSLYQESLYSTKAKIRENRLYAAGRQDIKQYMPMLDAAIDNAGDSSWLTIDWSISSPAPKFVNILVGDMMNQDYKVQFNAVDSKSRTRKELARDEYFGKMIRKKDVLALEAETGVKLENMDGFVPADIEELDMWMEMDFKEAIEIAMEDIVDWTFFDNDFDQIKPRIFHDLVENNKGSLRIYWDENFNIRCRYSDIGNLITSYTDDPYYNDTEYEAEVYMMSIRELRNLSNGTLTEEQLFTIAQLSAEKFGNKKWSFVNGYNGYNWTDLSLSYDDYRVEILDFSFYTTDVSRYEDKTRADGRKYFTKKDKSYKKPERSAYDINVVDKQTQQCYTGYWVIGTEYIASYGRERNITRPKKEGKPSPKLLKKFLIVEPNKRYGSSNSIIDQIKGNLDDIQLDVLKSRHFKAEAVPAGMAVDIDSINSINVGDGKGDWSPLKLFKLFKQKGIQLFSRTDDNGDQKNGKPIEFMENGLGDGLRPFMEDIAFQLSQIASITGINEARDGSKPDKEALVGVQKLQLIASNNATRELYTAFTKGILERAGLVFSRMVQDKIEFAEGGIEQYDSIIGRQGVKTLNFIPKDIAIADFGIKTEALPTGEDLQDMLMAINDAVSKGEIRFEDGLEIKKMNPKKASKYLKFRKKKYQEEAMKEMAMKEQLTSQREQASTMAAAEKEKIKLQAKAEAEMAVLVKQYELMTTYDAGHTENLIKIERAKGYNKLEEIVKAAETDLDETKSANPLSPQPKVFPSVS